MIMSFPDIDQTDDNITKWEGWRYPNLLQDETPTLNEKLLKENLVEGVVSNSAILRHSSRCNGPATSTTSCSPFQLPFSKKVSNPIQTPSSYPVYIKGKDALHFRKFQNLVPRQDVNPWSSETRTTTISMTMIFQFKRRGQEQVKVQF